jgi:multiple sugar transport system ATP-binding protein
VREPAAYLLDEPLSNLDAKLRVGMRAELSRLHERLETTTVYVTHDQIEAMTLGQRVTVMRDGVIQQVGPPQHLYDDPANLFVAAFIGSPSMNLVEAEVDGDTVRFAGHTIPLARGRRPSRDGNVILGLRPEAFEDVEYGEPGLPTIGAPVSVVEELGAEVHVFFHVDAPRVDADAVRAAADTEDEAQLLADAGTMFTARVDTRTRARVGETIRMAVNAAGFHFFDPDSGLSLRTKEQEPVAAAV